MMCYRKFVRRLVLVGSVIYTANSVVFASGFRVPESSVAGVGSSNALVANYSDLGALAYNPAGMAFHSGLNLTAGLVIIEPNTSVKTSSGNSDSDPNSPFYIPNFYLMKRINDRWSAGLSVNAPFGLETKWDRGTFPNFGALVPQLAGSEPKLSRIKMFNVNPNAAFKINENTSVAAGIDYYNVTETKLNTQAVDVDGDGTDWGWNIAGLYKVNQWSFGASYRSSVEVKLKGDAEVSGIAKGSAELDLKLPYLFQIGARYKANEKIEVEFDIERTGWNSFDEINVKHKNPVIPNPIRSKNDWDDANAYRLGLSYDVNPKMELRVGYTYDETPQDKKNFTARIPDADRHLFSLGAKHMVSSWILEWGFMYVLWDDRNINNATPYPKSPTDLDANGTNAYNGNYESDAYLFSLGMQKTF